MAVRSNSFSNRDRDIERTKIYFDDLEDLFDLPVNNDDDDTFDYIITGSEAYCVMRKETFFFSEKHNGWIGFNSDYVLGRGHDDNNQFYLDTFGSF